MTTIKIRYENDRGTPEPEYIRLEDETGQPSHPRLWWIEVVGETQNLKSWLKRLHRRLAAPEVAAAMLALEGLLGIKNPTDSREWESKGIKFEISQPTGFVNWPDPDLGQGW
jgi:hypothetical protein